MASRSAPSNSNTGGLLGGSKKARSKRKLTTRVVMSNSGFVEGVNTKLSRRQAFEERPAKRRAMTSNIAEDAAMDGLLLSHIPETQLPGEDDDDTADTWIDEEAIGMPSMGSYVVDLRRAPRRVYTQTRAQLNAERAQRWEELLPDLAEAMLEVHRRRDCGKELDTVQQTPLSNVFTINVIELLDKPGPLEIVRKHKDEDAAIALMRHGYVACTPAAPALAIGLHVLEFYHQLRRHHPRLGFQAFTRALCALACVPYRTEFRRQFSDAFDTYLFVLREIDRRVQSFLGRDTPGWRIQNSCPACTHKVDNEQQLPVGRLWTMDGNSSLKRNGNTASNDARMFASDYALTAAQVDVYKDEVRPQSEPRSAREPVTGAEPGDGHDQPPPCVSNWKNLQPEHMKRALDRFFQTGGFVSACRHGFILFCSELIRSGELAKHPLAHCAEMLTLEPGANQHVGYDIGCGFSTTLHRSTLGPRAEEKGMRMLVGSFHGHAHNRLCQLSWHPLLVPGVGLEDFETCERIFFESNDVARLVRYASTFHYRQYVDLHWRHWDNTRYEGLSRWLVKKFHNALQVLQVCGAALNTGRRLGYGPEDFEQWVKDEREYLQGLQEEPAEDVLAVSYVQALQGLEAARTRYRGTERDFVNLDAGAFQSGVAANIASAAQRTETARRQASEKVADALDAVHRIEDKLGIAPDRRWTTSSPEWQTAMKYLRERKFRLALDKLERLVSQRLLEFTKANMSDICYKMRANIAKSMKNRSAAIRTALAEYNTAARELESTVPEVTWDEIVEWTELQDFSLLSFARRDVRDRPWAKPTNRLIMINYFKTLRAQEELDRCAVEARRLLAFVDKDDQELREAVARAEADNNSVSVALTRLHRSRLQVNSQHRRRLEKLSSYHEFTARGHATPIDTRPPAEGAQDRNIVTPVHGEDSESENDEVDDNVRLDVAEQLETVMRAADSSGIPANMMYTWQLDA